MEDLEWFKLPEPLRELGDLEKGFEYYYNNPLYTRVDLVNALGFSDTFYYKYKSYIYDLFNTGLLYHGMSTEAHKEARQFSCSYHNIDHGTLKCITACYMAKFSDIQIATLLEISPTRWGNWKHSPAVKKAITEGTTSATARVINSLFRKAVGGTIEKEKVVSYMGNHEVVTVKEEIIGDFQSIKLWLMNHSNWATQEQPSNVDVDLYQTEFDVREGFYNGD